MRRLVLSASISVGLVVTALAVPAAAGASTSPPSVSTVIPAVGKTAGGTPVTITGKGFTKVKYVEFGAVKGSKLTVASATKLTVTSPKHAAGMVDVRLVSSAGASAKTAHDHFDYIGAPTVYYATPAFGPLSGGTAVTLLGRNFSTVTEVLFGRTKGTKVKVVSSTKLTVVAPKHASALVQIRVVTAYGESVADSGNRYQFAQAAAQLTGAGYEVASSVKSGALRFTAPSFTCSAGASWGVNVAITAQQVLAVLSDEWEANVQFGCLNGSVVSGAYVSDSGELTLISHPKPGDRLALSFTRDMLAIEDDGPNSGSGGSLPHPLPDGNTPKIAYLVTGLRSVPNAIPKLKLVASAADKPLVQSRPVAQSQILSETSSLVPSALAPDGKTFTVTLKVE